MHCAEKRSQLYSGVSGSADSERRQMGGTGNQEGRKSIASAESGLLCEEAERDVFCALYLS